MPISKSELKKAFREVVSLEFSHIPCDEKSIAYTFSENFNKKMEKLIKVQRKAYWNFINTASKRVAIALVVIFAMFTTAFSVKAIREPIIKFITEVYETFASYYFDGDVSKEILKVYSIKKLPEGFEQTSKIISESSIITVYEDQHENIIDFTQLVTNNTKHTLDIERDAVHTEEINGNIIYIYEANDTKQAMWIKDEYSFELTCYGNITMDTIKEIIKSIE
ncbi:MAG: DUF4367 domain-containing protein [Clostridia bacterium]|nr:DUF4367 domain-containing protein [Clostridia bacterium]